MTEWRNVAAVSPLDRTGTLTVSSNQLTATISTSAATTMANELVITDDGFNHSVGQTVLPGAGWNSLLSDVANGIRAEYRIDLPAAVASETVTSSVATTWAMVIATFKPSAAGSGAVLDPGFYYFNGSGFAGGGGICLNGGTLLARDVTMEFVNQAGFSSGDCSPGGGAACTRPCRFGSKPRPLSACPPNSPADSPSNHTCFPPPCNHAPPARAAACPGGDACTSSSARSWPCWRLRRPQALQAFRCSGRTRPERRLWSPRTTSAPAPRSRLRTWS